MSASNQAEIDQWNGRVGVKWATMKASLDAWVAPATAALKAKAGSVTGKRLLDIGCGTGETCAMWLDAGAQVTGVDVSAPMLEVAAERTGGKAALILADASEWKADAPYDLAVSQFGLMFFADPDVAFANIAANISPGGRLIFVCWRPSSENAWVSTPMGAIRDLLPAASSAPSSAEVSPPARPAPGPFALSDRARLEGILQRSGFADIAINPFDFPVCFASEGGVEAAVAFAMQLGPSGAALVGVTNEIRMAAAERLRVAFTPHDRDGFVSLGGATWIVEAVRPI